MDGLTLPLVAPEKGSLGWPELHPSYQLPVIAMLAGLLLLCHPAPALAAPEPSPRKPEQLGEPDQPSKSEGRGKPIEARTADQARKPEQLRKPEQPRKPDHFRKPAKPRRADQSGKSRQPRKPGRSPVVLFFAAGAGWFMSFTDIFSQDTDMNVRWQTAIRVGVLWKWLEGDLQIGLSGYRWFDSVAVGQPGHTEDVPYDRLQLTVLLGFAGYSLRHRRIRIRHGFHLGVGWYQLAGFCREKEDRSLCREKWESTFGYPYVWFDAHFLDLGIRLFDGLWIEISALNVGYPNVYTVSVSVRWEGIRLR
jgi:hypothetical protein